MPEETGLLKIFWQTVNKDNIELNTWRVFNLYFLLRAKIAKGKG